MSSRRARRSSWGRSARPGRSGSTREIGSLVPGKRADLAVVSLAGSAYLPWEDPAGAVVFGGSPDRVIATYVDGESRYEKGGMDWHELTAAAHSARRAMLAVPPAARPVALRARSREHDVLPPPAQPGEVGFRLPHPRLRGRLHLPRRRLRAGSTSASSSAMRSATRARRRDSISEAQENVRERPAQRAASPRARRRAGEEGPHR